MVKKPSKNVAQYKKGDRIFAKLKGYPWWPARIESVEKNDKPSNLKYKILFYGTYETNVLRADSLVPFNKESLKKYGEPRKYKFFNEAMNEIKNDPNIEVLSHDEENQDEDEEQEVEKDDVESKSDKEDEEEDKVEEDVDEEKSNNASVSSSESKEEPEKNLKNTKSKKSDKQANSLSERSRRSQRHSSKNEKSDKKREESVESHQTKPSTSKPEKNSKKVAKKQKEIETNQNPTDSDEEQEKIEIEKSRRLSVRSKKPNKRYHEEDEEEKNEEKTSAKARRIISDSEDENDLKLETLKENKKRSVRSESMSSVSSVSSAPLSNQNENQEEKSSEPVKEEKPSTPMSTISSNSSLEQSTENQSPKTVQEKPSSPEQATNTTPIPEQKIEIKEPKLAKQEQNQTPQKTLNKSKSDKPTSAVNQAAKEKNQPKPEISTMEFRQKILAEAKEKWRKMTQSERESEKNKLKEKKIYEKKLAKIKSIRIQFALLRMDVEIKKSLKLDNTDVKRCCLLMQDLIKLPFTQKHLFKAPEIVETIRKCRKFKGSEKVKEKANECFYKFLYMFSLSTGDSFWTVFEKERVKYLAENEEELKKERILANKLLNYPCSRKKSTSVSLAQNSKASNVLKTQTSEPIKTSTEEPSTEPVSMDVSNEEENQVKEEIQTDNN